MNQVTDPAVNTTSTTEKELATSTTSDQAASPKLSSEHASHVQDSQSGHDDTDPSLSVEDDGSLPDNTSLSTESMSQAYVIIDKAKQDMLRAKFEETINNPRFWAKGSRYDTVMSALSVPVFDDRSLHQYYIHATDDLINEAALKSVNSNLPVVMPIEDEIKAEVWRRYEEGLMEQEIKSLNQLRKAEAKIAGTKPVKVLPEDVRAKVDSEMAKLRASENC